MSGRVILMVQEKGSILVFALIVVAVLMVVGVTFTSVTTAEYRAAIAHTSSIQAFYVAEAGLAWAMQGILSGSLTFPTNLAVGQEYVAYRSAGFAGAEPLSSFMSDIGDMRISYIRTNEGWNIVSEGKKNLAKSKVSTKVDVGSGSDSGLPLAAMFGTVKLGANFAIVGDVMANSLEFNAWNTKVTGDVYIVGDDLAGKIKLTQPISNHITGTVSLVPSAPTFSPPDLTGRLPQGLTPRGSFTAGWNPSTSTLPGTGSYDSITVRATLLINVPGDADVIIRTKNLTVNGAGAGRGIYITGSGKGRLIFHVENTLSITADGFINTDGSFDKVDIYYYGTQTINLGGASIVKASLIAHSANVNIGASGGIVGHVITGGNSVTVSGAAEAHLRVLYAPNAVISLTGNGKLKGIVVGRELNGSGASGDRVILDGSPATTFTRFANALNLWPTGDVYTFHTWGGR
ncbi:MAG: hypothetical protein FD169_423 [Bacillota bacterium]|nr:MAG: hypothetical protein FD169_423 [Bacillota bacterium]